MFHFIHTINIYIKTNLPERKLGQLDNGIHQELYGKKGKNKTGKKNTVSNHCISIQLYSEKKAYTQS